MTDFKLTEKQKMLAKEYCKYALQFASTISFGPKNSSMTNKTLNNGTITLLSLNGKQLGITNQHVVQEYRNRSSEGEDLICQIGNVSIDIESCLISECSRQDLAVLDLSSVDPQKIRGNVAIPCQFHQPSIWPAPIPNVGDFVLFGGFPFAKREEAGSRSFIFGTFSSGATEVISVQPDVITCSIQIQQCIISFDYDGRGLEGLPGISGAPVMLARELQSNIIVFDLIGIVFEYSECFDALRIRPMSFFNEEGLISQ